MEGGEDRRWTGSGFHTDGGQRFHLQCTGIPATFPLNVRQTSNHVHWQATVNRRKQGVSTCDITTSRLPRPHHPRWAHNPQTQKKTPKRAKQEMGVGQNFRIREQAVV